jgi:Golgi phosphoprotein 3 GPP34
MTSARCCESGDTRYVAVPDRIAVDLLRMARDPASGRIRHRSALDIALRAALFAELALNGKIVDEVNAPALVSDEPTGDRIFDAIRRTVAARPNVMWRRWFRHVRVDRAALCAELVDAGRWERTRGWPAAFSDANPEQAQAIAFEVDRVARFERAPRDSRDAVLTLLAISSGAVGRRPRPAAVRRELKSVLDAVNHHTAQKVVVTAATVTRRSRRGLNAAR